MYTKISSVLAVLLAACAGVQGIAPPAERFTASTRCGTTVVLATVTSTHYVTRYTTANADIFTKSARGDDHPHGLAARQAPPVTTTMTSTSTRTIATSTSTVTTTLINTSTARGAGAVTVTSTVTGQPAGRTETVTSMITSMVTSTAPTPTPTTTVYTLTYIPGP